MFHRLEMTSNYNMWCYGKAVGCKVFKDRRRHRCLTHGFVWIDEQNWS